MAKDPAILFYTSDFISGTITMTDAQRGQYILLLCLQHQKGYLTEKDMLKICNTYDEDIWCKFVNDNGKFYNQRLKEEAEKRQRYSESRRNNRKNKGNEETDKKNICKTYDKHMENENENENIDDIINKEGIEKIKKVINNLCKGNEKQIYDSFETWRDYLIKQHDVVLNENEYTYQILLDAVNRIKPENIPKAIDYSIKSNYKKIYEQKENQSNGRKKIETSENISTDW